jgi:PAS domain S-box-containing protein
MKFNLNKLFPFLSIRKKLIIAFTLLSFIPLTLIGLINLYNNFHTLEESAFEDLNHDVSILSERAKNFLINMDLDIRYLCNSPVFIRFIENLYKNRDPDQPENDNLIVQQFQTFARTKKVYYQLHFIDKRGNEIFKIQYDEGDFRIVPQERLSAAQFRFYFLLTDSLPKNQVAFIPVELIDRRQKKIPAISYAARIYNAQEEFLGIFIADVFAKDFFKVLEGGTHFDAHHNVAIVNSEGYYLYHSEKKKNWNQLLATRKTQNLAEEYSPGFSNAVLSGQTGIISGADNIAAYIPLFIASFQGGNSYYLFESVGKDYVLGPAHRFTFIFLILLLIFLAIAVSAGFIATGQLAGPVRTLQKGAEIIARGNYDHRLTIDTNDEIEELAHQFNKMADAIRERENLLEDQQKRLEETVQQRTAELRDEKEKLQAILDNVPSAFLLLDENGRILSASAAVQKITGHCPEMVVGRKCFEIFSNKEICENCAVNNPSSSGKIAAFIETQSDSDGETAFIEHISIPLTLHDQKPAYLEMLTDITERKKFEEHLLQTERLAATGEMSAVIAHEIRNSLTSVKMLLQLQREKSETEEAARPLEVAAQSVYRMEEVVNNLLRFAKPTSFEFQCRNINRIIEESIQFLQPQLDQKNACLIKELHPGVPEMRIDDNHIREALINLLLNATQAIKEKGEITIGSEFTKLSQQMDDYAYSDIQTSNTFSSASKVVLPKDEEVVKIEIKDNGPGILPNYLSKIFDPFFTTKLNGTGLGLTTVKRTVNQHGGIIRVKSKLAKGTNFQIILPVRRHT